MRKKELYFDDKNIKFTLDNDVLNRKPFMATFIKLLNSVEGNYFLSLNGNWGVGKTFFIKQLMYITFHKEDSYIDSLIVEEFRNKYVPIYYNAWENDCHENVFQSILYSILNDYFENSKRMKKDISKLNQDFNKIIKPVLTNLIEKGTLGFIPKETFENIKSFENLVEEIITSEELKDSLFEVFNLLLKNNQRILFIVDELDRCKPDYAVKVLETIKHFLNYEHITILVVTNNKELSHTIKHVYGYDFDAYGYLNRMYDNVLSLDSNYLNKYIEKYMNYPNNGNFNIVNTYFILKYMNFSLRECNSFFNMLNLVTNYLNIKDGFYQKYYLIEYGFFLIIGLALKVKDIKEYERFINGNSDEFILNFIKYCDESNKNNYSYTDWVGELLTLTNQNQFEEKIIDRYHELMSNNSNDFKNEIKEALSLMGNKICFE